MDGKVNRRHNRRVLFASSFAILSMAGALAIEGEGPDATSASVAALKENLGNPAGLEIDEVRVTDSGVTCIEYRMSDGKGGQSPGHAVVRGNEVLKSPSGDEEFEKAWNAHCLGPRGGISSGE
jgi:hypothetical protein